MKKTGEKKILNPVLLSASTTDDSGKYFLSDNTQKTKNKNYQNFEIEKWPFR